MAHRRKLIDCQYFQDENIVVIQEILNGNRNHIIIKDPDFHYYIEPELKQHKKETKYYKEISQLKRVDCKYKDRFLSVAKELGIEISNPAAIERDYEFRKKLLADHNLYSADDSIEFRTIVKYFEDYKDEIDDSLPINFMFFDIEVHADFNKNIYLELEKAYEHLEFNKSYNPDLSNIYMKPFEYIQNETNLDKVAGYIKEFALNVSKHKYFDIRFYLALMNSKAIEIDRDRVVTYLRKQLTKTRLDYIYSNIGFPDEEKANNRIDAISFVDSKNRKLYMYLLKIENDLESQEDINYINNTSLVNTELSNFIELFNIVSFLTNIDNKEKEICKELLDNLDYLTEMYKSIDIINDEDKIKVNSLIEKARVTIPNYDKRIKTIVEYVLFDNELDMILSFFDKVKNEIKPNIIAAHNAKFDINTLKNRLSKYGVDFNKQINQLTVYNDMDLDNLQSKIKIDLLTMEKKKDKTRYFCPGVTIVDTLLLYAKTASKEKNWSLDAIVQEELKDSKIPYKFEIFEFYMKDIRRFIKYSAVDTMLLLRLEEVLKFIELFQLILANSKTEWNSYMYRTMYLTNMIKYELGKRKDGYFVLRDNLTSLNPRKEKSQGSVKEVAYDGAYNTPVERVSGNGLHTNLYDLDFSSFYPSSSITTNICVDVLKFSTEDKTMHNDYLFKSRIGLGNKYFNLPSSKEIYDEI